MDQVITFDKSLQERLREYCEILSDHGSTLSEIAHQWSDYLEFCLDPNGWQAVWKIPRSICEQLEVSFPIIVLVYVESVDFNEMIATVVIIAVQDDVSLQEEHYVPLTQLWPTKLQDKSVALNIERTANVLDMYRFFYTCVLFPWDSDDTGRSDWISEHLESRLRLYYDMMNGVIPSSVTEHIKSLLTQGKTLQARRERLESQILQNNIDEQNTNDERVIALMEVNFAIIEIKNEIELLENPLTRIVIMKRQNKVCHRKNNTKPQFWIVHEGGTVDGYFTFLEQLKPYHPDEKFQFATNLIHVLEVMNSDDTIVLDKTLHFINSSGGLQNGGHLKGIYEKESTIITSTNSNVMLDFDADVVLENLTLNASNAQCGILVRSGKTTLRNCKLVSEGTSSTQQGVIVLNGATLMLERCELSGFFTAVVGNSGAKIVMEKTVIFNASYAIKMFDYCGFKASDCTLRDCKKFGLCLETNKNVDGNKKIGSYELLEIIPEVSIKDLNGGNNANGDVLINQKPKLTPMEDLFSNPDTDPTKTRIEQADEEEEDMDFTDLNVTVVAKDACPEAGDKN